MSLFQSKQEGEIKKDPNKSETIIGPSVVVEGDFRGEGNVIVAGTMIGSLFTKQDLFIKETAVIRANVSAQNIVVSGEIQGNMKAKGRIDATKTAKLTGDIQAAIIHIEAGALIEGKCSTKKTENETIPRLSLKKEVRPLKVG